MKLIQLLIAGGVMSAAIYAEQTLHYKINGNIIGAWGFMAAYGITLGIVKIQDLRSEPGGVLGRFRIKKLPNESP